VSLLLCPRSWQLYRKNFHWTFNRYCLYSYMVDLCRKFKANAITFHRWKVASNRWYVQYHTHNQKASFWITLLYCEGVQNDCFRWSSCSIDRGQAFQLTWPLITRLAMFQCDTCTWTYFPPLVFIHTQLKSIYFSGFKIAAVLLGSPSRCALVKHKIGEKYSQVQQLFYNYTIVIGC
jgi:hypothetical protein